MRKLVVGVIGSLLVGLGTILLFIPGPGLLLIAGGLAVLSLEFLWARNLFDKFKRRFSKTKDPDQGGKGA